jgi:cystathionine gamma-lyase
MAIHDDPTLGFATRAIHAGQAPDPTTGAVMTPVYYTSTYAQTAPGRAQGLRVLAHPQPDPVRPRGQPGVALEGGSHGFCFASGLAATSTLLQMFDAGDPRHRLR